MILPKTTQKQTEILLLLYRFRFLNRVHIQTLLHHKDYKTIFQWLTNLRENGYIERDYSKRFGENTKPAVFWLAHNGIRYLKNHPDVDKALLRNLYREKQRSPEFVTRCLFLADIFIHLQNRAAKNDPLTFYTQSNYLSPTSSYQFLRELSPDAYFVRHIEKSAAKPYLLHIIPESLLRFRSYKLRRKIRQYIEFFLENVWGDHTNEPFPTVLFILPDLEALIYLKRFIKTVLHENDNPPLAIRLTTKDKIVKYGFTAEIWEEVS